MKSKISENKRDYLVICNECYYGDVKELFNEEVVHPCPICGGTNFHTSPVPDDDTQGCPIDINNIPKTCNNCGDFIDAFECPDGTWVEYCPRCESENK